MKTIEQIKKQLEAETGLKISVRINPIISSMRGYVTFATKKQNGQFVEWGYKYNQKLAKQFEQPEPYPTFSNKYQLSVYYGEEAYNSLRVKKSAA